MCACVVGLFATHGASSYKGHAIYNNAKLECCKTEHNRVVYFYSKFYLVRAQLAIAIEAHTKKFFFIIFLRLQLCALESTFVCTYNKYIPICGGGADADNAVQETKQK